MKRSICRRTSNLGGLVLALAAVTGCSSEPKAVDLVVDNVTIYSGIDAQPVVGTLAVDNGTILAVGPIEKTRYTGSATIDGSGMFVTPGLWEAHAHLRSSPDGFLGTDGFLARGVTSVRDLGSVTARLQALEHEIAKKHPRSLTVYPSYTTLNGELFGVHQRAVTTEEAVAGAIDELVTSGARIIKIHRALAPEMLPVVIREAHRQGLKITGHIPLGVHPLEACEQGMDGIEHLGSFIEALVSVGEETGLEAQLAAGQWMLSAEADPLYDCLTGREVAVTPTLIVYKAIAERRAEGGEMPTEFVEMLAMLNEVAVRLHEEGVPLLAGSDVSDIAESIVVDPGVSLHEELVLLEQAGIAPGELVEIASLNVARSVGADAVSGSIEVGKVADFILLSADPAESAQNYQFVVSVFKAGEKVFEH